MSKEILLTIAIPTYNRAEHLRAQLERLCSQQHPGVELLVSDNASADNTREVVASFAGKLPGLTYLRNAENVGFDRNIIRLYAGAKGQYIWFLSDDDAVLPGAVTNVLALLVAQSPTVSVLGTAQSAAEPSAWKGGKESVEIFNSLGAVDDYRVFTKAIFLSGLVVEKDPMLGEDTLGTLAGTNFVQLSLSLILLSRRFKLCLGQALTVVHREPGYVTKCEIAKLWFCGPAAAMTLPAYGYDPEKVRRCVSTTREFAKFLISAKIGLFGINPAFSTETARQFRDLLGITMLIKVWLLLFLFRITPAWPLKSIYWFRCIFRYGLKDGGTRFSELTTQALSSKASGF